MVPREGQKPTKVREYEQQGHLMAIVGMSTSLGDRTFVGPAGLGLRARI